MKRISVKIERKFPHLKDAEMYLKALGFEKSSMLTFIRKADSTNATLNYRHNIWVITIKN